MKKTLYFFSTMVLLFAALAASAQLTIVVNQIPANTPEGDAIHVAGNFQGWDPASPDYMLDPGGDGSFSLTFTPPEGSMVFKFTRGSWETVEGNSQGQFLPDRMYTYSGGVDTLTLQILSWEDQDPATSTAASNVSVISTDYYIPQLDRTRRIWVYLPPDYATTTVDYPVIYMHDGQNVFDAATSFAGEWEVDETLNDLHAQGDLGAIVVAIDNGGASRIDELSPWINADYGGGEGDAYMQFIISTLKPDIDATYRTLPDRDNTALIGSSLGGLITHYAAVQYESVFSKVGIFSPSYWFATEAYALVEQGNHTQPMRIYIIAGGMEGGNTVANTQSMYDTFLASGYETHEVQLEIHDDGEHSEWYWAREFGAAYEWLFAPLSTSIGEFDSSTITLYPNPASSMIELKGVPTDARVVVLDSLGREVIIAQSSAQSLDVSVLRSGNYTLRVTTADGFSTEKSFVVD